MWHFCRVSMFYLLYLTFSQHICSENCAFCALLTGSILHYVWSANPAPPPTHTHTHTHTVVKARQSSCFGDTDFFSPKCTLDIFVTGLGWMVTLCQRGGNAREGSKSEGGAQVVLTSSVFLLLCWTNISTLWSVCLCGSLHPWGRFCPFSRVLSKRVNKGGGGWDGRREGQTNHLGSPLFVVLFL